MSNVARAPKQWQLTKHETVNSFENWRQNLMYILALDPNFAPYLADGVTWLKKTAANPARGFEDDGQNVAVASRKTAAQKNATVELMLGQIANYCCVISRNSIIKGSTSLPDIWQKIRQHYGFQSTGAHFLDLADIKMLVDERPEDLYQRLMAFFEDNLLTASSGIKHHGEPVQADEDLTPTLENTVVFVWLQLVHPGLPNLVKQKYGSELRNKSLASLKPEISQALTSLLDELRSIEDTRAARLTDDARIAKSDSTFYPRRFTRSKSGSRPQTGSTRQCSLCKRLGRSYTSHNLLNCRFLTESDKQDIVRSRLVLEEDHTSDDDDITEGTCVDDPPLALLDSPSARRVDVVQSPYMNTYFQHHPVRVTLDTGATSNMISSSFAKRIKLPMSPANQRARQADGITPLDVLGEVHCRLTRGDHSFQLDALVVKQLDVDVLAGNPFLVTNDIATRPAKNQVVIRGSEIVNYGPSCSGESTIRRTQAYVLRGPPASTVVLPGEYIEFHTPPQCDPDLEWAIEPRLDSKSNGDAQPERAWPPPQVAPSIDHKIRLTNATQDPITVPKHDHVCQIRAITTPTSDSTVVHNPSQTSQPTPPSIDKPYSTHVCIDPDGILSDATKDKFRQANLAYDDVFRPSITKYNGASGKIESVVNMGPTLPPQRKGRVPQYNRNTLVELQDKCDNLETYGVLAKPEEVGVTVEYLNPSFLIRKPNGGSRLVTSFGEVGQYSKPQPSLMPDVGSVFRNIANWEVIIKSDLLKAFYQIPLARKSMKYCGIVTPFKGIRVYTRCAMGMPGSETCLEELMSRILGNQIQNGTVAKIADDLFVGGHDEQEALHNWTEVLQILHRNNITLSADKTIICPKSTNILGWIWTQGTLSASPHRVTALATVDPPTTVQGLRSFVGAYKVLSRVLRGYSDLLNPLDRATAGKQSRDKINWSDDLLAAFKEAQLALRSCKTITIPRPSDTLWVVTDGSVKKCGIAATLYAGRGSKLLLAGFFNAKLKRHQVTWLPCEIEALCISAAVKHFAPFIIQSSEPTQVLTDSKPCVQAYDRLCRGEFSASSRVTTFLSTVSRYHAHVRHIAGIANLPSDYTSRHPPTCTDRSCQICTFIQQDQDSVIRSLTVQEVIQGSTRMPFTSRAAWLATQQECGDLRRTHAYLQQGTRPTKKMTRIPDVKRYLKDVTIASDGMLIVRVDIPFQPTRERIVVPRQVLEGLITAIHIRFNHPSPHQTRQVFNRYFFALDADKAINTVGSACHFCSALKKVPTHLHPQTSNPPPDHIGVSFAADVMKRQRQLVFILRETITSYTLTSFIPSEKHSDLRDTILILCAEVKSLCDAPISIRVDPAPGFCALVNDPVLRKHNISLDVGNSKNPNKNPVAENAIQELGRECLNITPEGGPLSPVTLALATANINSRLRSSGLSARELWTQRDQITGEQLPITDRQIILSKHFSRTQNHGSSAVSKSGGKTKGPEPSLRIGDLVFLYGDGDKTHARDKYIVTDVQQDRCKVRKFTMSQYRSKVYDVPITSCYPVSPTALTHPPNTPIRDLYDSDTDTDQTAEQHVQDSTSSNELYHVDLYQHAPPPVTSHLPELPCDIVAPPETVTPPETVQHPETVAHPEPDGVPVDKCAPGDPCAPRRSTRTKRPPKWQREQDTWELS